MNYNIPQQEAELRARFERTAPEFQAVVARIAEAAVKTPLQVYILWSNYCRFCSDADQSPVVGEFVESHAAQLGCDRAVLHAAAEPPTAAGQPFPRGRWTGGAL